MRASTFVAETLNGAVDVSTIRIPIIGGHSGKTIVPVFSQMEPASAAGKLSDETKAILMHRIQFGGDEVVKAKDGAGSATLSMAYAGARFASALLYAVSHGMTDIKEPAYVHLDADRENGATLRRETNGCDYFATTVVLGVGLCF